MYLGGETACPCFTTQGSLILKFQAAQFPDEEAKVTYIIMRLRGRALDLLEQWDSCLDSSEVPGHTKTGFYLYSGGKGHYKMYKKESPERPDRLT